MQLLMRPTECGLSKNVGLRGEQNLQLLATLFIYILRKVYTEFQQPGRRSLVGHLTAD